MIDFLIVGAGLYGSTAARLLTDKGYSCKIIDRRKHIAGNIYTENKYDIDVHVYGPHIFHTDNKEVFQFINKYSEWNQYIQNTIAYDGYKLYNLPFNCTTYYEMFGTADPEEYYNIINKEIEDSGLKDKEPENLEEQAIKMVGMTIYKKLIKYYTEKQWGKSCKELSPEIIKRLPLRFSFNNNYFNDRYQCIPKYGYTVFIENLIDNIPVELNTEFDYQEYKDTAKVIIYCGAPDELCDYKLGNLEWRSLRFENYMYEFNGYNGQGMAIKNFTGPKEKYPYTRIYEHMWFTPERIDLNNINEDNTKTSIITYEYPDNWNKGKEKYYPVNNKQNQDIYDLYYNDIKINMPNIFLGGRLGKYMYFDMDDTIIETMNDIEKILELYNV